MPQTHLTVIVPVYNEADTVLHILRQLQLLPIDLQIVVVDDGSMDGTASILAPLERDGSIILLRHATNLGKGAAIQSALPLARGIAVVVQDADTEYHPRDLLPLLEPILDDEADVVFGNRFHAGNRRSAERFHYPANKLITWLCNRFLRQPLRDVETCYKMVRRELFSRISLEESGFSIEVELVLKLDSLNPRILEKPIAYSPRTRNEGKKIRFRDGIETLISIARYGCWQARRTSPKIQSRHNLYHASHTSDSAVPLVAHETGPLPQADSSDACAPRGVEADRRPGWKTIY